MNLLLVADLAWVAAEKGCLAIAKRMLERAREAKSLQTQGRVEMTSVLVALKELGESRFRITRPNVSKHISLDGFRSAPLNLAPSKTRIAFSGYTVFKYHLNDLHCNRSRRRRISVSEPTSRVSGRALAPAQQLGRPGQAAAEAGRHRLRGGNTALRHRRLLCGGTRFSPRRRGCDRGRARHVCIALRGQVRVRPGDVRGVSRVQLVSQR